MEPDQDESLVHRRSRRSTAGNRMEAALAELSATVEPEQDDVDFVDLAAEEDVFESDFASTEEEDAEPDQVEEVELRPKRPRISVTTRPKLPSPTKIPKPKLRPPRLSDTTVLVTGKRQSTRATTILNTKELQSKLRDSILQRSTAPKPKKPSQDGYRTQHCLFQLARAMEQSNVEAHKNYLASEEEKRSKATTIQRVVVTGPKLTWVSKAVMAKNKDPLNMNLNQQQQNKGAITWVNNYAQYYAQYAQYGQYIPPLHYAMAGVKPPAGMQVLPLPPNPPKQPEASSSTKPTTAVRSLSSFTPYATAPPPTQTVPPPRIPVPPSQAPTPSGAPYPYPYPAFPYPLQPTIPPPPSNALTQTQSQNPNSNPNPVPEQTRKEAQSFLIHEDEREPVAPTATATDGAGSGTGAGNEKGRRDRKGKGKVKTIPWAQHMTAVFGDHVNWEEVKVLNGKVRTNGRPVEICPITGRKAKYLDPKTAIPYADVGAYKVIGELLEHKYVWSDVLECYVR